MQLRPYQKDLIDKIYQAWNDGNKNVLAQLPTGGGKTVIMSYITQQNEGTVLICAHRFDLVCQISITLAHWGIEHHIIATDATIKEIEKLHCIRVGRIYINTASRIAVSSKDTLIRRDLSSLHVSLLIQDEAHHVVRDNSWGRIADIADRGLFLTATPERCDGKGLGRQASGVIDTMVCGPSMKQLQTLGYLAQYKIIAPKFTADISKVNQTSSGEYNAQGLFEAMHKTHIYGNIVDTYKKFSFGKPAICFSVNMESCILIRDEFLKNGIPAEIIKAETPVTERAWILEQFRQLTIKILINVDILGEGTDIPEVEAVILARPTKSLTVYLQQVGRCLRPSPGKTYGLIIDHVNNWARHGLPDDPRIWSLENVSRRTKETSIKIKVCENVDCMLVYDRCESECPYCGFKPKIKDRSSPEHVDGDLTELSPETIAEFRKRLWEFDNSESMPRNLPKPARIALNRRREQRREAQKKLRIGMTDWINNRRKQGYNKSKIYKTFFIEFGIDIYNAQLLNKKHAEILLTRVLNYE